MTKRINREPFRDRERWPETMEDDYGEESDADSCPIDNGTYEPRRNGNPALDLWGRVKRKKGG